MNGSSPDGDDETYEQLLDSLTTDDELDGDLDESPELRFELPAEDEHHLGSSRSWQDRSGE